MTIDHKVLTRVRALLAKAESTDYPDEADALTQKAQELMARYAIDRAMVATTDDDVRPSSIQITVDNPYASPKATLVAVVARVSRCQAIWTKDLRTTTVFGYPDDLATVELLYTSLLVQATTAMTRAGREADPRFRSRRFRHSFLLAFAQRIGQRLTESQRRTVDEAQAEHGAALVPLLNRRARAVEEAVAEAFPHVGRHRSSVSDGVGWAAGTTAADNAALGNVYELHADRRGLRGTG